MQTEDRIIYLSLLRRLQGMVACANSGILRAASRNELDNSPKKPGYYQFYCIHDKHKWNPCRACGRSKRAADSNRASYNEMLAKLS